MTDRLIEAAAACRHMCRWTPYASNLDRPVKQRPLWNTCNLQSRLVQPG